MNITEEIEATEAKLRALNAAEWAEKVAQMKAEDAERFAQTVESRWGRAVKSLRKDGVKFRTNVVKCCRGCITESDLNMPDVTQPYGYTYGGQGHRMSWDRNGNPLEKSRNRRGGEFFQVSEIYINWGNGSAAAIVAAFEAEGFTVVWDGSEYSAVVLKIAI